MTDLQFFTLMMASAQVVETSVNTNSSPSEDYTTNPDDHSNHNVLGVEYNRAEQSRTKQSRAEQNGAEQSRAEQNRAEQNKIKQNRTE